MSTTGPILRRGNKRPQVVFSDDHRTRTIGRQVESEAGRDGSLGFMVTPNMSIRKAVGSLGKEGGRLFFTEGVWMFDGSIAIDTPNIHFFSTSPGRTVFKRPATSSTTASMLTFSGDGAIVEGIRFIDKVSGASAAITCSGTRGTVKNCVFEDVVKGITVSGNWCAIRDCDFLVVDQTTNERVVEFTGSASNGLVLGNMFQELGGTVYLGDSVSNTAVLYNVFDNAVSGDTRISYFASKEIVTGSALNVVHANQVEERS